MKKDHKKTSRKKLIVLTTLAILVLILAGLGFWYMKADKDLSLTPKEALSLIESREDLLIVDVRGYDELHSGWIDGSTFMPFTEIVQGRMAPPRDRPILLVCAVGGRSLALAPAMVQAGWPEVYNLTGGIAEWKLQGLPLKYQ